MNTAKSDCKEQNLALFQCENPYSCICRRRPSRRLCSCDWVRKRSENKSSFSCSTHIQRQGEAICAPLCRSTNTNKAPVPAFSVLQIHVYGAKKSIMHFFYLYGIAQKNVCNYQRKVFLLSNTRSMLCRRVSHPRRLFSIFLWIETFFALFQK